MSIQKTNRTIAGKISLFQCNMIRARENNQDKLDETNLCVSMYGEYVHVRALCLMYSISCTRVHIQDILDET